MNTCNKDIRTAMRIYDVKQWQLAKGLGMAETTLCRKLRTEVPPELRDQIITMIKSLAETVAEGEYHD